MRERKRAGVVLAGGSCIEVAVDADTAEALRGIRGLCPRETRLHMVLDMVSYQMHIGKVTIERCKYF